MVGHFLAMKTGEVDEEISGVDTVEPAFGLPAIWITSEDEKERNLLVIMSLTCQQC